MVLCSPDPTPTDKAMMLAAKIPEGLHFGGRRTGFGYAKVYAHY